MNAPLRSGPRLGAPVSRTARSACSPASQKENTPMTPWTLRIAVTLREQTRQFKVS